MTPEELKQKILRIADPKDSYTQNDFSKECADSVLELNPKNSYKIPFKFKNISINPDPEYATAGSSGFDLRASLDKPTRIWEHNTLIVPTGLFFHIPEGFEIQIRPRSGLAAKNGITVLNSPGTIDSDYRGEIKVILINHSGESFLINNGDRIAQAVIATVIGKNVIDLIKVSDISENTERGSGGFGSTGKS